MTVASTVPASDKTRSMASSTPAASSHRGNIVRREQFGGLILQEIVHPSSVCLPRHIHADACFSLILSGGFRESFGHGSYDCMPGTLLFRPPAAPHSDVFGPSGARVFFIETSPEWMAAAEPDARMLSAPAQASNQSTVPQIARRIYQEWRNPDSVTGLIIKGLMLELAAQLQRTRLRCFRKPTWLTLVHELIEEHFVSPPTLAQMASFAGVHQSHVVREFRRHYHCTPGGYVRQLRVRSACNLLAYSDISLVDIAENTGFAHHAHFSRTFRRYMGTTPRDYRNCVRQSGSSVHAAPGGQ